MNENTDITLDTETVDVVKAAPARPKTWYEQKRVRTGKTRRDHESGATKRRLDNNALRAGWSNNKSSPFPHHVCSGLGNSSKRFKVQAGKIVG